MEAAEKFPEHDKLDKLEDKSQSCSGLDLAKIEQEKRVMLAGYAVPSP